GRSWGHPTHRPEGTGRVRGRGRGLTGRATPWRARYGLLGISLDWPRWPWQQGFKIKTRATRPRRGTNPGKSVGPFPVAGRRDWGGGKRDYPRRPRALVRLAPSVRTRHSNGRKAGRGAGPWGWFCGTLRNDQRSLAQSARGRQRSLAECALRFPVDPG